MQTTYNREGRDGAIYIDAVCKAEGEDPTTMMVGTRAIDRRLLVVHAKSMKKVGAYGKSRIWGTPSAGLW